jgi:hypothetical protein
MPFLKKKKKPEISESYELDSNAHR